MKRIIMVMLGSFILGSIAGFIYETGYRNGANAKHEASKYSITGFVPSDSFKKCMKILEDKD